MPASSQTINGDSNVPFYKEFAQSGPHRETSAPSWPSPWLKTNSARWKRKKLVGHLAAWNYYQSIDTPENKKFVAAFKKYCKDKGLARR